MTDDEVDPKDDPHDDITDRLADLPKTDNDSNERAAKRNIRRTKQSDVQRKKPSVAKGGKT